TVIYPHAPANKTAEAKSKLEQLIRKHQALIIAIGNGTACRETEQLVSELISDLDSGKTCILPDPPPPPPKPVFVPPPAKVVPPPNPVEGASPSAEGSPPAADVPPPIPIEPVVEAVVPPPEPVAPPPPPEPVVPPPPPEPLPDLPKDIAFVIVNEAGASDYSASPIAREEFPNFDATTRGTISIGRRLQDPLAELVKIDPQHVGVGLYQHDVRPKHLKESLEAVIESCVNEVGVELNTASVPLLRHVSGLNQLVARDIVEYRTKNGPFRHRAQLKEVPGIGDARFTQAAGFLKIPNSEDPFDTTWIHPESYAIALQALTELGFAPADLRDPAKHTALRDKLNAVNLTEFAAKLNVSEPAVNDIFEALAKPGRDPRDDRPPPIFKKGILKLEDLQPGMELKGTVLNVVPFGAFVDIGLKDTGLVHISQMANRYIKNPYEIVAVGDVVTVWVLKVEEDRRRASLTMISPGTERKPPERRPVEARPPREPREERPPSDRGSRPPRPPMQQRPEGQQQPQRGGPPSRGGPPQRGGPPRGGPRRFGPGANVGEQAQSPPLPPPPPPPPKKPQKPKALPKLSQDALKGKAPLHTFGELEAFFKAKDAPPPPPPAPPAPEAAVPPPVESPSTEAPAPTPPPDTTEGGQPG
ncbi:MAG: helix-hairpin-helix domain-containing protein, partial [Planctomycetes bacterium]|nr:helix-hairpin-helix domain-containing protein [Planctomycetota bacterium]